MKFLYLLIISSFFSTLNFLKVETPLEKIATKTNQNSINIYCKLNFSLAEGLRYYDLGNYKEAENNWKKALIEFKESNNQRCFAQSEYYLGKLYYRLEEYAKADKFLDSALQFFKNINGREEIIALLTEKGKVDYSLGQYAQSIDSFLKSLKLMEGLGDFKSHPTLIDELYDILGERDIKADSLLYLGYAHRNLGHNDMALEYFQEASTYTLEIEDRDGYVDALNGLGDIYLKQNKFDKALEIYEKAYNYSQNIAFSIEGAGDALMGVGSVYLGLQKYKVAVELLRESIPYQVKDLTRKALAMSKIAHALQKLDNKEEAITLYEESIQTTLSIRKGVSRDARRKFIEVNRKSVVELIDLLVRQKQVDKALTWSDLVTTAELADYSRLIGKQLSNPQAQAEIEIWEQKHIQLKDLQQQVYSDNYSENLAQRMRSLEEEINLEAEQLIDKYPEVAELLETKPEDSESLKTNIPEDTLVIKPVLLLTGIIESPNKIAIFILTKDQPIAVEQIDIDPQLFNALLDQYREQLALHPKEAEPTKLQTAREQLYDLLIQPVEERIAAIKPRHLSFILTGKLRYIPLETLYDTKTEQYLIEKYPINYLTRLSTRQPPRQATTPTNPRILAFGNPKPEKTPLIHAEQEAQEVTQIFPGSKVLTQKDATLEQFKLQAPRFNYLHLATHACFNPEGCNELDMEPNTILFADQAYSIANASLLNLTNTELIVLSACQTAKEVKVGEEGQELAGLAYIFERAGAKAIIASLWDANDVSTRQIMVDFYKFLNAGMTKSEALRAAKRKQIQEFNNPFSWAHLVLIGNGQ